MIPIRARPRSGCAALRQVMRVYALKALKVSLVLLAALLWISVPAVRPACAQVNFDRPGADYQRVPLRSFQPNNSRPKPMEKTSTLTPQRRATQ